MSYAVQLTAVAGAFSIMQQDSVVRSYTIDLVRYDACKHSLCDLLRCHVPACTDLCSAVSQHQEQNCSASTVPQVLNKSGQIITITQTSICQLAAALCML